MADRLNAADLCTRDVTFVYQNMAVDEAARLMREHHVGSVVVVNETEQGRVVMGMLTDRDIVTGIVARNVDPATVHVEDAMSTELVSAREDESIVDVLSAMRRKGVRRVPVVDGQGVLVGLLALDDMLEVIADELRLVAQAIEGGRQREARTRP